MQSIFVSSTFQDMHQERDLLHNQVLPEIRDFARAHGQAVLFQDLRWGVDTKALDSSESTMKVLQVCFDEIDAAKPFFIVFLGDRYGWVPEIELVQFALNQQRRVIHSFQKKSITELEILYAVLESEEPVECLFYFRSIDNLPAMEQRSPEFYRTYAAADIQDSQRMRSLKNRIRQKYPDRVREYHVNWNFEANCFDGLREFGELVKRDLLSLLAQRLGPQLELSWQQQLEQQFRYNFESDAVQFPPERCGFQSGRLIELLQRRAPENIQSVWVNARDRRALDICMASAALYAAQNGWEVIPYDCGDSLLSSNTQRMLSYLTRKLSERMDVDDADEADARLPEAIRRFRAALEQYERSGRAELLIVLRGLDRMDEENWRSWFPEAPLRRVRFLISGVNADVSAEFSRNNPSVIWELRADQYACLFLSKHGKQIDEEVMEALLRQAKDMPLRYIESALGQLLNLGMEDYRAIRQSGDGIDAISAYLRRLIDRLPKSLHDQTERMIASVGGEIGLQWTRDVLSILAALPNSISLLHLEKLLRFGGQTWSQLQITWLLRQLSFLLSDTLDGHIRLSGDDARQDLRDILLVSVSKWRDIISRYMETLPPSDEFYRSQYLLLAHARGDYGALWRYLERCGEGSLFLNLSHILHRRNGSAWLIRSLDQINGEPALAEKHLLWCAMTLYPWLKAHELCTEDFLPAWTYLSETARKRYQQEATHERNQCLFHFLFLTGEQNRKLHRTEAAMDALEQAIALAEEDMRRWPNHIYCKLHGIQPDGTEPEPFSLARGDELVDALMGRSYSGSARIAFQYLRELYAAQGSPEKAEFARAECERYTQLADPNPTDELKKTIAPGVTIIMPDAWKDEGERPAEKKRHAYRPDLRRNTAIQQAKDATERLKRGEYREALELYRSSNEILIQIHDDGETGELYDIDREPAEREALVRRIASECLRDLGLNYDGILKCCYALEMPDECRSSIRQGLAYCREFDRIRNSEESKEDLVNFLFVAVHYYHYMSDAQGVYESACELLSACCEAVRKTGRFDSERRERFSFARGVIMDGIEAMPERGTELFALLLRLTNDSARNQDLNSFIQLTGLCRDLLLWMLDHGEYWTTEEGTAEFIATNAMFAIAQLYRQRGLKRMLYDIADGLEDLAVRLNDDRARHNCAEMLTQVGFQHFSDGEYAQAAQLFQLELRMAKSLPREIHCPLEILQDYARLVPALSESGQYENADQIGCEALKYARVVRALGCGESEMSQGMTAAEFREALASALAEINLNMGVNYSRLRKPEEMDACFDASERYAQQIQNPSHAQQILRRIASLRGSDLSKHQDKLQEAQIRNIVSEIDRLLDEVKGGQATRARLREIADRIYDRLQALERIDAASFMLGASKMAWYYHWCGKIFLGVDAREKGKNATLKAKEYIEGEKDAQDFFAEIYTNLSALTADEEEQTRCAKSAIRILEELQKAHQLRSEHSLAMAYFNYGVMLYNALCRRNLRLLAECGENPRTIPEYADKARAIWRNLANRGEQSYQEYLTECDRLSDALREILG